MSNEMLGLRQRRAEAIEAAQKLVTLAEGDDRDFTEAEEAQYQDLIDKAQTLGNRIDRAEATKTLGQAAKFTEATKQTAPTVLNIPRGDSWGQAFSHWAATGDPSGLDPEGFQPSINGLPGGGYTIQAASNATDMNIGTAADGGNLVPTGFYNEIIARRDEMSLVGKLPLLNVPGVGTTVDVPYDNEADGEFVVTSEASTFDLDSPAMGKKSLTLAMYTKYIDVSYQLLNDSPTNLLAFLSEWVGRGMAKTQNNLLLTEVASNGTSFKTFASATAIAFGEPEDILGNNDLANYMDDDNALGWVMRSSTHWDIKSIVGNDRQYAVNGDDNRTLLGYPVHYSQKAAATAASAKDVYFGNWRYVGYRESPGLTFIRDPYTVAVSGQVRLLWHFQTVFGVLQAEAVGYGVHPSA